MTTNPLYHPPLRQQLLPKPRGATTIGKHGITTIVAESHKLWNNTKVQTPQDGLQNPPRLTKKAIFSINFH